MNKHEYDDFTIKINSQNYANLEPKILTSDIFRKKDANKSANQNKVDIFSRNLGIINEIDAGAIDLFQTLGESASEAEKIFSKENTVEFSLIMRVISSVLFQFGQIFPEKIIETNEYIIDRISIVMNTFKSANDDTQKDLYLLIAPVLKIICETMESVYNHQCRESIKNLYQNMYEHAKQILSMEYNSDYKRILVNYLIDFLDVKINDFKSQVEGGLFETHIYSEIQEAAQELVTLYSFIEKNMDLVNHPEYIIQYIEIANKTVDIFENSAVLVDDSKFLIYISLIKSWAICIGKYESFKNNFDIKQLLVLIEFIIVTYSSKFPFDEELIKEPKYFNFYEGEEKPIKISNRETFTEKLVIDDYKFNTQMPELNVVEEEKTLIDALSFLLTNMNFSLVNKVLLNIINELQPTDSNDYNKTNKQSHFCFILVELISRIPDDKIKDIEIPWSQIFSSVLYLPQMNEFVTSNTKNSYFCFISALKHRIMEFFVKVLCSSDNSSHKRMENAFGAIIDFAKKSVFNYISIIPLTHLMLESKYGNFITTFGGSKELWELGEKYAKDLRNMHFIAEGDDIKKVQDARVAILQLFKKVANVEITALNLEVFINPFFDLVFESEAEEESLLMIDTGMNTYSSSFFLFVVNFIQKLLRTDGKRNIRIITSIIELACKKEEEEFSILFNLLSDKNVLYEIIDFIEENISDSMTNEIEDFIVNFINLIGIFGSFDYNNTIKMRELNIYSKLENCFKDKTISYPIINALIVLVTGEVIDIKETTSCIIKNSFPLHLVFNAACKSNVFPLILNFFERICKNSYSNCFKFSQQMIPEFLIKQVIKKDRTEPGPFTEEQIAAVNLFKEISSKIMSHSTLSELIFSMARFEKDQKIYRVVEEKDPLNILIDIVKNFIDSKCIQALPGFVSLYKTMSGFVINVAEELTTWSFVAKFIIDSIESSDYLINRDIIRFQNKGDYIRIFIEDMMLYAESNLQPKIKISNESIKANVFQTLVISFVDEKSLHVTSYDEITREYPFAYNPIKERTNGYSFYNSSGTDDKVVTNVSCFHIIPTALNDNEIKEIISLPPDSTSDLPSSIISISTKFIIGNACINHAGSSIVTFSGEYFQFPQTLIQSISYFGGINVFQHMILFSVSSTVSDRKKSSKAKYVIKVLDLVALLMNFEVLQKQFFQNNGMTILSHLLRKLEMKVGFILEKVSEIYNLIKEGNPERNIDMLEHIYYDPSIWKSFESERDKIIECGHNKRVEITPTPYIVDIYKLIPSFNPHPGVLFNEIVSIAEINFTQKDHDAIINNIVKVKKHGMHKYKHSSLNHTIDLLTTIHNKNPMYNKYFSNDEELCEKIVSLFNQNDNMLNESKSSSGNKINSKRLLKVIDFAIDIVYKYKSTCFNLDDFVRGLIAKKGTFNAIDQQVIDEVMQKYNNIREDVKIHFVPLILFIISYSKQYTILTNFIKDNIKYVTKIPEAPAYLVYIVNQNKEFLDNVSSSFVYLLREESVDPLLIDTIYHLLCVFSSNEDVFYSIFNKSMNSKSSIVSLFYYLFFSHTKKIVLNEKSSIKDTFNVLSNIKKEHEPSITFSSDLDVPSIIRGLEEISTNKPPFFVKQVIAYAVGVLFSICLSDDEQLDTLMKVLATCTWKSVLSKTGRNYFIYGIISSMYSHSIQRDEIIAKLEIISEINSNLFSVFNLNPSMIKSFDDSSKLSVEKDLLSSINQVLNTKEKIPQIIAYGNEYATKYTIVSKQVFKSTKEFMDDIKEELLLQYIDERCLYRSFTHSLYQIDGAWNDSEDYNYSLIPRVDAYGRIIMLCIKLDLASKKQFFPDEILSQNTQKVQDMMATIVHKEKDDTGFKVFTENCYYSTLELFFKAKLRRNKDSLIIIFIEETGNGDNVSRGYEKRDIPLNEISNVFLGEAEKDLSITVNGCPLKLKTIDIFMKNGKNYQIGFKEEKDVLELANFIKQNVAKEIKKYIQTETNCMDYFSKFSYIKDWKAGRISTTEFLMRLSVFSGFSFRNFNRYPVFPFLFKNYKTFDERDLTHLFDMQNQYQIENKRESRMHEDSPYHTEYITNALHIAIKLPQLSPWNETHIRVQNGNDNPNRTKAYLQLSVEDGTAGECPVLWYTLPQIFENYNKVIYKDTGIKDCRLPGKEGFFKNFFAFVQFNSEKLESDEISSKINDWIDLVYGSGLSPENLDEKMNTFTDVYVVSSPCQQIMKKSIGKREYGRTVISDNIVLSQPKYIGNIYNIQYRNGEPVAITSNAICTLSTQMKKDTTVINCAKEVTKFYRKNSLFAFINKTTYSWDPSNCAIVKADVGFLSRKEEKGCEDVFALTRALYENDSTLLIIRNDCSIERIDSDLNRIFFKIQNIGKYVSSDLSHTLRIMATCSNKFIIINDPYTGQSLSKISLFRENPLMIKILETPVIAIAYRDEVIIQRIDHQKRAHEELTINILRRFTSNETITSICAIDLVGSASALCVFTENKKAYIIYPTENINDGIVTKEIQSTSVKQIQLDIIVTNSLYNKDESIIYASDSNSVISININAKPVKLN